MVDIGTAILISSFISLMGIIIVIELNNRNWFKRKNFMMGQKVETIKLKKLERDLNLKPSSYKEDKGLIESIKELDLDKIKTLISAVSGDQEQDEGDLSSIIANVIENNPELVKEYAPKLLEGFTGKKEDYKIPIEER